MRRAREKCGKCLRKRKKGERKEERGKKKKERKWDVKG
jgi:hypothetical protein